MMNRSNTVSGSFRDPSGFVFCHDGSIYRQVNHIYKENYNHLIDSNLYKTLVHAGLMIPHREVDDARFQSDQAYRILKPRRLTFISYPYEWCFSQLKDAALTTLKVQQLALDYGMTLKDASAYNIQFDDNKPVFIDTLSFEKYREGQIWFGYRQFCQQFLAPLALMSKRDIRLNNLSRIFIDGIPLDLTVKLLPWRCRLQFSLLWHIYLHSGSQRHFAGRTVDKKKRKMSRPAYTGLIDNLRSAVEKLHWRPKGTEWGEYYEDTNYSPEAMNHKKNLVKNFMNLARPKMTWDLGANTGVFSRIAAGSGSRVIAFDMDPAAVEKHYNKNIKNKSHDILPLVLDLTNPSGGIGWENRERKSLVDRGPADTVLALALIHHLAISNNLPFEMIADFFQKICRLLIIEFVPKSDSQVQRLLSTREDIFPHYTKETFELIFKDIFVVHRSEKIKGTERILYMMERRKSE